MENYKKALELGEKFKDLYIKADCDHHIGKIKFIRGNFNQALVHFQNSLEISKKIKKVDLTKDNYKYLSDIYSRYGNDKRSFEYFKLYTDLKDRIFNEESASKIAAMQTKFEMGEKEKEVEILKKNNQIQKLKLNRQRIIRNGLIIVFILVLIIVLQFFKKYRYLLSFWKKKNYISHYKVVDKIASGGMGIIYKAHDILDNSRTFAVKVLRDEYFADEIQKKRFKNEASIIDQFNHPNIVKIIERGESSGNLYIVMELLNGKTLSEIIKEEGQLIIGTVLNILIQVTDALVKIHRKNIIHRDLKPENIMIIKTPENPYFVKLLDFGLAKTKAFSRLTKTGIILGTIFYLSPEQILGSGISTASDVYSMGIICCEMLTVNLGKCV
jgi:tRNA A-37 threonylcarbamoyl transferase component Bud32